MAVRDRHERVRLARTILADGDLDEPGDAVRRQHGERDERERPYASPQQREHDRDAEPDQSLRPDLRQRDEDVVERMPPVVDDPVLSVSIPRGQTGAICFVWSISCCRSNGFPTNACAPLEVA